MISVIIPVYNTSKYLERCINSVLCQEFSNIELILVDDGSTDGSGEICDNYHKKDRRVKVIHKKNGGLSDARNVGIEYAKGEYIAFVDSDDYVHSEMLKVLYDNAVMHDADISMCNFWWIDEQEIIMEKLGKNKVECFSGKNVLTQLYDNDFEYQFSVVVAWNKLYRKTLFEEIRYPLGRLHEDEFIIHRLLYQCKLIAYSPCKLYYYMKHNESITGYMSDRRIRDTWAAFAERASFFQTVGEKEMYGKTQQNRFFLAKSIVVMCEQNAFPEAGISKSWILQQLRKLLGDMKQEHIIDTIQYVVQLIWTYQPRVGEALDWVYAKTTSFAVRCVKAIRNM